MKALILTLTLFSAGFVSTRMWTEQPLKESTGSLSSRENSVETAGENQSTQLTSRITSVGELLVALKESEAAVGQLKCYSCQLDMHEMVDGRIRDPENVEMKVHEDPFRVYMRWRKTGQEALFCAGQHDGRMLVHPSKGLAAMRRLWKVAPDSRLALKSSRYPITDSGLRNLTMRVVEFYDKLPSMQGVRSEMKTVWCRGRLMTEFKTMFPSKEVSPEFSTSRYLFDAEQGWLVHVENFGWESHDLPIEKYKYHSIRELDANHPAMFDHRNSQYGFVAQD